MLVTKNHEHKIGVGVGCNDADQGVSRACTGVMNFISQLRLRCRGCFVGMHQPAIWRWTLV